MPFTDPTIWFTAENSIFQFLISETNSQEGSDCFIGRIPTQAFDCWSVEISGGTTPLDFGIVVDTPGGCNVWKMNAPIRGVFREREQAQLLAGMIKIVTPIAESSLDGVFRFYPLGEPTIEWDTITDRSDERREVWVLDWAFEVILQQS